MCCPIFFNSLRSISPSAGKRTRIENGRKSRKKALPSSINHATSTKKPTRIGPKRVKTTTKQNKKSISNRSGRSLRVLGSTLLNNNSINSVVAVGNLVPTTWQRWLTPTTNQKQSATFIYVSWQKNDSKNHDKKWWSCYYDNVLILFLYNSHCHLFLPQVYSRCFASEWNPLGRNRSLFRPQLLAKIEKQILLGWIYKVQHIRKKKKIIIKGSRWWTKGFKLNGSRILLNQTTLYTEDSKLLDSDLRSSGLVAWLNKLGRLGRNIIKKGARYFKIPNFLGRNWYIWKLNIDRIHQRRLSV